MNLMQRYAHGNFDTDPYDKVVNTIKDYVESVAKLDKKKVNNSIQFIGMDNDVEDGAIKFLKDNDIPHKTAYNKGSSSAIVTLFYDDVKKKLEEIDYNTQIEIKFCKVTAFDKDLNPIAPVGNFYMESYGGDVVHTNSDIDIIRQGIKNSTVLSLFDKNDILDEKRFKQLIEYEELEYSGGDRVITIDTDTLNISKKLFDKLYVKMGGKK